MLVVKWGVLGARSHIARTEVIPAIQSSKNGKLVAVASRAPADRDDDDGGDAQVRRLTYEELLNDAEVDAIYIPLPNSMHLEWASKAADAGKHVLCEKPLALNTAEAEALARVFEQRGVTLMEGFMYRFHPQHARVRELIRSDAIGDVVEVRAHLSVDLMSLSDQGNVRFNRELGGGALLDMGCYGVSASRMIFGEEPIAVRSWWRVDERFGVDIAAAGILEFSRGRVALVSCSFEGNGNGSYSIVGRKGIIEAPRALILGAGSRDPHALLVVVDADGGRREERLQPFNHYRGMVEEFAAALLEGRPPSLPIADAVSNARVLDAFATSARQGQRVELPR